jgi:hypothetical protein
MRSRPGRSAPNHDAMVSRSASRPTTIGGSDIDCRADGHRVTNVEPNGPTYVGLDCTMS